MSGSFSRNKGGRGEREVIKMLQPIIDRVYRNFPTLTPPFLQRNTLQSHKGGFDITGLDWAAIEVKRVEKLQLTEWWRQAVRQAKEGQEPFLFYRRSREKWSVRCYGFLPLAPSEKRMHCVVTIDVETFLAYFELRLIEYCKQATDTPVAGDRVEQFTHVY